jgi:hypothetical protein
MILENTFAHHVLFWLNDKADKQKFVDGLQTLTTITSIKDIHIGVTADSHGGPTDDTYDVSLLILFSNAADHDSYEIDPIHQAFIGGYSKLCAKVIAYDSINA